MDLGLAGKTAMVAGGSGGLGYAVAAEIAVEGASVTICGRDEQRINTAVERLRSVAPDSDVRGWPLDVRDEASVGAWVQRTADLFGGIDIVVANAGGPPAGMASSHTVAAYRNAVELNLLSSISLSLLALPHLRKAGRSGRVLFITSIAVKQPVPAIALSNTARAGVLGFAKSLVHDLAGSGVTVNVLAPGLTRTQRLKDLADGDAASDLEEMVAQVPLGRLGEPEEFAAVAAFLASERAGFVNGAVIPVDGGAYRGLT